MININDLPIFEREMKRLSKCKEQEERDSIEIDLRYLFAILKKNNLLEDIYYFDLLEKLNEATTEYL